MKLTYCFHAPALKIDQRVSALSTNEKVERRIVHNLIRNLWKGGWDVHAIDDGEGRYRVNSPSEAMEEIFNLDFANLYFKHTKTGIIHRVFIVCGNGVDAISDYTLPLAEGDGDTFEEIINAFLDLVEEKE